MSNSVHAGVGDYLDALHTKKIVYKVSVVDNAGNPVPYATLWQIVKYRKKPQTTVDLMPRLVRRYSIDLDYITNDLHPSLLIHYTDQNGQLELTAEAKETEDRDAGSLSISIAALKRGFQPAIVVDESKLNTTKNIVVRLQLVPQFLPDSALMEFDNLRGAAETNQRLGTQSIQRGTVLEDANARIRRLAKQAEQDAKRDIAATLYHYLAYMPSVEVFTDADGRTVGGGFTNGYDEKNPRRRGDYQKALALNISNGQLLYEKMREKYRAEGAFKIDANDIQRKAFLADSEGLRQRFGDRLWPFDFQLEWKQYAELGAYDKSCAHLNRFYQFEPSYFNAQAWIDNTKYITFIAKQRGVAFACSIDGLQK